MTRIIGGMFDLQVMPTSEGVPLPFLKDQSIFLTNARSGIWLLVQHLLPGCVWMPSYLCPSMLDAVDPRVAQIKLYEVDYNLAVASSEWIESVQPNDVVVFIDYFGFTYDPVCAARVKERGAWVLEDASQALLSEEIGRFSDFTVFSPRKFVGIPDGGILTLNCEIGLQVDALEAAPAEWWLKAFVASVMRREFDLYGGSRQWFELFQQTEADSPIGFYAMSELSRMILLHSIDYPMIAQQRCRNYEVLVNALSDLALFPNLPSHVVPLGFPIRVRERDEVRRALFAHEIYPPVHWSLEGAVPESYRGSHKLAAEIMTLPCDQRYNSNDMERLAQLVRGALRW